MNSIFLIFNLYIIQNIQFIVYIFYVEQIHYLKTINKLLKFKYIYNKYKLLKTFLNTRIFIF